MQRPTIEPRKTRDIVQIVVLAAMAVVGELRRGGT